MSAVTSAPASGAFGQALRQLRRQRRLSPRNLALDARIDRSHISRLESGSRQPSRAMVLALADALHATDAERSTLLGAAGYAFVHEPDPLVADLDAMLRDERIPKMTRDTVRMAVGSALLLAESVRMTDSVIR